MTRANTLSFTMLGGSCRAICAGALVVEAGSRRLRLQQRPVEDDEKVGEVASAEKLLSHDKAAASPSDFSSDVRLSALEAMLGSGEPESIKQSHSACTPRSFFNTLVINS